MPAERWGFRRIPGAFHPVRELEDISRRLEDEIVRPIMRAVGERIPEEVKGWYPPIEAFEKADNIVVRVELPGVKESDIDISVSDDSLTVRAERKPEGGVKDEEYYRSEFSYGSLYRSIQLPVRVDADKIKASFEDGILHISLQRAAGAKSRKINIQVKKEKE